MGPDQHLQQQQVGGYLTQISQQGLGSYPAHHMTMPASMLMGTGQRQSVQGYGQGQLLMYVPFAMPQYLGQPFQPWGMMPHVLMQTHFAVAPVAAQGTGAPPAAPSVFHQLVQGTPVGMPLYQQAAVGPPAVQKSQLMDVDNDSHPDKGHLVPQRLEGMSKREFQLAPREDQQRPLSPYCREASLDGSPSGGWSLPYGQKLEVRASSLTDES